MNALPPGPSAPSLVQLARWIFRPIPFLRECNARFGDHFTIRFPAYPPVVFTSDPETIRDVFRVDPDLVEAGRGNLILKPLLQDHSLLLLDGPRHRAERKLLAPPFHGERMRAYGETMRAAADASIDRWPTGRSFPFRQAMQGVTLDIILRTVFGYETGPRMDEFRATIEKLLGLPANPSLMMFVDGRGAVRLERLQLALGRLSPYGRFAALRDRVGVLLQQELERRRAATARGEDVLSLLLEARDEGGRGLSDEELRGEMLTLVVAGHETTATALAWVLYRLARHEDVRRRALEELDAVAGGEPVGPEHVRRLAYLAATIKETLRLNPVIPIVVRRLTADATLGALSLPRGAGVAPCIWLTQRRPDVWGDPEAFRPERFLEGAVRSWHFFPFGGGNRTCIGMAFAQFEMTVVAARILQRMRIRLPQGYDGKVVRRSVTFAPARDMPLIVEPRGAT
ncbi:MAG: cytochrome P450 [bacterium]|nr:cytochrome P450 [bacterium]